jgi:hypothetical protein
MLRSLLALKRTTATSSERKEENISHPNPFQSTNLWISNLYSSMEYHTGHYERDLLGPHTASLAAQTVPFESPRRCILSPSCGAPNHVQHTDLNLGFWTWNHYHIVNALLNGEAELNYITLHYITSQQGEEEEEGKKERKREREKKKKEKKRPSTLMPRN